MSLTNAVEGALFARNFLEESIEGMPEWKCLKEAELDRLAADLRPVFATFPVAAQPDEAQTEDDLILPVLKRLGWTEHNRQQPLTPRMSPDGLQFADAAAKAQSVSEQFFEIDLATALGVTGLDDDLFGAAATNGEREKAERRLLFLMFRREAFLPRPEGWDTFHRRAIDEGRRYEAKLDALYFYLWGVTDRGDIGYIYSTFPIVEKQERKAWASYRSLELCLAWMNELQAGDPDARIAA